MTDLITSASGKRLDIDQVPVSRLGRLLRFLTWWNRWTLGTWLFTQRYGTYVGEDEFGSRYYRDSKDTRRWVIFAAQVEASLIPPAWRNWLTNTRKDPPIGISRRPFEKPHQPNLTGSPLAYRPSGSLFHGKKSNKVKPDYESWSPE